ncbi:hypothetical protein COHA_002742 [Chlorella ohadii]|uniref:Uncharacterized protein n=1 Tax=Chlorella ohadii TaxID=2649997 RepID=A0AAD5H418_9CHLO|nr:hypothetical protein COHA_002742 [Chlorella ohadii]
MYQATLSSAQKVRCEAQAAPQQPRQQAAAVPQRRRLLLAGLGAAALALPARPAAAAFPGIESIDLPAVDVPAAIAEKQARNQAVLDAAEQSFQESDLLRTLKERSEANRDARKKALEDKYCMRQAELGVGDCGGLRYIPGMTKSGVQKRPEWMDKLFGMEGQESSYSGLSSAGGSNSDSEREGSPAAAAAELARVRRRQAEVDQERAALAAQLDLLEERQEDLYDEADVLFDQEGALVEQQGALVERECQLEGQLESLQERQEALFEEEETLAEQERQLQSLLGSQEGAAGGSWSVDVGGGGWSMDTGASGSGGEERQEWGTASLEDSEEEDEMWDPRYFNSIRAKWMLDGCTTLEECRQRLRERIEWLQRLEDEGWELEDPVADDWGHIRREPPAADSREDEQ